ncbi:MAG: xanthine dehydrogenase family protein molybdopterin-binding subunit, partial [Polaromonas sp.]|nr:xanthine dehydrogenase family protein molybdopterin-binding subunit [Polaromonas sp.]
MGASDFINLPNIGTSVRRKEDYRFLTGGGQYTDDITLANQSYAVFVRSPHAHAKINSINTAAAKAAPGVLAVITAADWQAAGLGDLMSHPGLKLRDGSPMFKPRYPVLADTHVRFIGDTVAFIVADTLAQAQDATELMQVDYEELPSVVSTEQATQGKARVYDECKD